MTKGRMTKGRTTKGRMTKGRKTKGRTIKRQNDQKVERSKGRKKVENIPKVEKMENIHYF